MWMFIVLSTFSMLEIIFNKTLRADWERKILKQSLLTYVSRALWGDVDEFQGPGSLEMCMSAFVCVCVSVLIMGKDYYLQLFPDSQMNL